MTLWSSSLLVSYKIEITKERRFLCGGSRFYIWNRGGLETALVDTYAFPFNPHLAHILKKAHVSARFFISATSARYPIAAKVSCVRFLTYGLEMR